MKQSLFDRLKSQKTSLSTSIDENSKNIQKVKINIKGLSKMPPQLDMKSVRVLVERTKFNVMLNLEFQQKNNIPKTPSIATVREKKEGEETPLKNEGVKQAVPLASSTPQQQKPKNEQQQQQHKDEQQQHHHNQQKKTATKIKTTTQRQPSIDKLFKTRKCCVKIAKVKVLLKLVRNELDQKQKKQDQHKTEDPIISVPDKITRGKKIRKHSIEGKESPKTPTPQQTATKSQQKQNQQIEVKELPKTTKQQTPSKLRKQPTNVVVLPPPKPTQTPIEPLEDPIPIEEENEPSPPPMMMIVEAPDTEPQKQPVEEDEEPPKSPQIITDKPQTDPIEKDNDPEPMSPQTPANPQQLEQDEDEEQQIEVEIIVPSSKPQTPGQKRKSSEKSPSASPPKRKAKKGNEFFIKIGALTRTNSPRRKAVTTLNSSIVDHDKPLSPRPRTPLTTSTNINKQQSLEQPQQQPPKKGRPAKKLEKKVLSASSIATLRHKFGSRYFKSFVKIKRMNLHSSESTAATAAGAADASSSPPKTDETKKKKKNGKNLSVSFLETVEIFGESSDDDDWFDMDPKKSKQPIVNTESIFNALKTSTPCGPDIRNSLSISSSASVSVSPSSNNSSSGILKSSILDRKEKSSFSPLKEHESSPRKEQLKLANESFVPRSLETQIADEEEREVAAEDLEKESDKASSPVPDNDIADDVRPSSRESSPKPSDSTNESIANNPPSAEDEDESLKNSSKNSNEYISPADQLEDISDADIDDDDEDEEAAHPDTLEKEQEDEEEDSFKTTRCENTFEEPQESVDEIVNETAESNTNLQSCNDEEEEDDEDEEEPPKCVEDTEENTMNPETSLDDTNEDEEPNNQEQEEEANEDETHEDDPNEDDDGNEDKARQNDVNEDQSYEDEANADHQTNEDNTNVDQDQANLDDANEDIISKDDTCLDDGDEEPFLDPTALVASVLINRSPHPEDQRQEAVAVLNDACQIGADESNGVLITPSGHLSYHSPHNSVTDDDDDFSTVLRHPEAEKTLLSTASAGLVVPNSQEIIVAAAAVASQATMVAPPDVEVTEDTFASVVAEVERLTKDVNSAIYSADVGITGADVMMDNVQARHSLDDIFDDDVDDDIISSLRMSSGSIDIGHDKSLPIQVIETEVMGIPNEPDLIFDKPLGTTTSILSTTQMNTPANDTLAGHGEGGGGVGLAVRGGGGGGHTYTTESPSSTKLFGRLFQSVKSYVMSPNSPRRHD